MVARWLGHKDPRMVRQHYAFLLDYDDDTGLRSSTTSDHQYQPPAMSRGCGLFLGYQDWLIPPAQG